MSDDATRAVKRALGHGMPQTLEEAARHELVALWSDLDEARKNAINGEWSMQCDWITERIAVLARMTGATISPDEIPETVPVGLYQQITHAIAEAGG